MSFGPEMVWAWAAEIQSKLLGEKVSRIEGGDAWVFLSFMPSKRTLLFSWNPLAYGCCFLTEQEKKDLVLLRQALPPILSYLRSHLVGSELEDASQIEKDRLLKLRFSRWVSAGIPQKTSLILEASERHSNLVLLGEKGIVLECSKHLFPEINRYRSLYPGVFYTLPPQIEGPDLSGVTLESLLPNLLKIRGFGRPLLKAILQQWGSEASLRWLEWLRGFYEESSLKLFVLQDLDGYLTLFPHKILGRASDSHSPLEFSRLSVSQKLIKNGVESLKKTFLQKISKEIEKREVKLKNIEISLSTNREEIYNKYGRVLLSSPIIVSSRATEVSVRFWDAEGEKTLSIPIDARKSMAQNAQRYFDLYRKEKARRIFSIEERDRLKRSLQELKEQEALINCLESVEELLAIRNEVLQTKGASFRKAKSTPQGKAKQYPFRRFDLKEWTFLVGLSALGNRYVTFQAAKADDLWFHIKDLPGAHVILRGPLSTLSKRKTDDPEEDPLEIAASLAAWYSKAQLLGKASVDFTERRYVRAIPNEGPGSVTYKNFKTLTVDPSLWRKVLLKAESNPQKEEI